MPAPIERRALCALVTLLPLTVLGQGLPWPTPSDIDRALQSNPFPRADRIDEQPIPRPPRIDPKPAGIDIEDLVRRNRQVTAAPTFGTPTTLRIFITLDMPTASLQRLTDQAARSGAVLVLRGLQSHSMRATLNTVGALIGDRTVAWVIDPEAFTRYAVHHAPTFVLSVSESPGDAAGLCTTTCQPSGHVNVTGDVSLDYALASMLRHRPDIASRVTPILQRLRAPR